MPATENPLCQTQRLQAVEEARAFSRYLDRMLQARSWLAEELVAGLDLPLDAAAMQQWLDARRAALPAEEADWGKEYLDYIISIKTVESVEEAIAHIRKYGTGHSEAIVTENYQTAERFQQGVDAAAVYVNASTRFTDGGEFGFGAEIGISTQKLHARGPLGIAHMVSEKYLIRGNGQIR